MPDDRISGERTGTDRTETDRTEALAFAAQYRSFLRWLHDEDPDMHRRNEVVQLVRSVLGEDGGRESVVSRSLAPFEHVNLQTALDAWSAAPGRTVTVHGVTIPPHHGGVTLHQLVGGEALPPLRLGAPALVDLPDGPDSTLACLTLALLEVRDDRGHYVLMVAAATEYQDHITVEVAGVPTVTAQTVLAELDRLRSELNVYRGHLLEVGQNQMGGLTLGFLRPRGLSRSDVVLPEEVLDRVERHALGIAAHRDALRAAGQHLKRGLLLFGPPGTGKTHTVRYLLEAMPTYTRLILSGRSLNTVGAVTDLARELAPAVVVLEDVDLVAEDRSFGSSSSPVLFDLLDAMDGAAADADLMFLLTTNRADLLEPALAARPGRVDVAVEIDRPDGTARRRLLDLYGGPASLRLTDDEIDDVVGRTEGVTASFLKELVRRAVVEALLGGGSAAEVGHAQVARALSDLLGSTQAVTRTLLGVGDHADAGLPPGARLDAPRRGGRDVGWYAVSSLDGPTGPGLA